MVKLAGLLRQRVEVLQELVPLLRSQPLLHIDNLPINRCARAMMRA